jgi:hypothetical protein
MRNHVMSEADAEALPKAFAREGRSIVCERMRTPQPRQHRSTEVDRAFNRYCRCSPL